MGLLANPRYERFAQALALGKTATEAYALAGYKANDGNASRLKGNVPFSGMPLWAQWIGEIFPTTHAMRIVRGVPVGDALRYRRPPCGCRMVRSHAAAGPATGNGLPHAAA